MRRVAEQSFELLALMCATTHCGVQAKAVRIGAQGYGVFLSRPITVRRLSTFCPARGTGAIRQVFFVPAGKWRVLRPRGNTSRAEARS